MSVLISILYHDILPVFLVAGAGFVFGRLARPDVRVTNRIGLYIFSPCLVFSLIVNSKVGGKEFGQIAVFTVVTVLITGGLAWLVTRALRLNSTQGRAVILPAMFVNAGNLGLAVTQLAFGEEGLARASIYFVFNNLLVYTVGLYLAAGVSASPWLALKKVLGLPPVYAVLAAGLLRVTGGSLPEPLTHSVSLLGQAAIPTFLLLLGVQLSQASRALVEQHWRLASVAAAVRLVGGAAIALILSPLFGLSAWGHKASVLEASMPSAVMNTVVAIEFEVEPHLVSSIVMLSTLLAPFTLTIMVSMLR